MLLWLLNLHILFGSHPLPSSWKDLHGFSRSVCAYSRPSWKSVLERKFTTELGYTTQRNEFACTKFYAKWVVTTRYFLNNRYLRVSFRTLIKSRRTFKLGVVVTNHWCLISFHRRRPVKTVEQSPAGFVACCGNGTAGAG